VKLAAAARRVPARSLTVVLLVAPTSDARAREPAAAAGSPSREFVGQVLYLLNPTTVRTRGSSLGVEVPRGQSVVLVDLTEPRRRSRRSSRPVPRAGGG